jgi:hypothetical protein
VDLRRHLMFMTAIPNVHCPLWLPSHCASTLHRPRLNRTTPARSPEGIALWTAQLQPFVRAGAPERVHLLERVPEYLGAKPVTKIVRIGDRKPQVVCA